MRVLSSCCEFEVGCIENADAYCYICGHVHDHGHLDLRPLRTTLLGKVVRRHNVNWEEIQRDAKKFGGMERGVFCQSILTEIEALCPHGNPVLFQGQPLRLHMCYGSSDGDSRDEGDPLLDLSVQQGLDFTSDLCCANDSTGIDPSSAQANVAAQAEDRANTFAAGSILRYNPQRVAFELA